ncbi:MAG: RES family NAD+ phosphorylase [Mycobacteriaceae bacterium]|nr:RES family NAD+ phosphorylase [Mycobacteriaceae bacterium]
MSPEPQGAAAFGLNSGTRLFRVHKKYRGSTEFNPEPAHRRVRHGRFDSSEHDGYSFYYAALSERGAVYETLVSEAGLATGAPVPRSGLEDLVMSTVELTRSVSLVSLLSADDLARVNQDSWLVRARPNEYHLTRQQASLIRSQYLWGEGLIWYSRKEPEERSLVLFGDRCGADTVRTIGPGPVALDSSAAAGWLAQLLEPHALGENDP